MNGGNVFPFASPQGEGAEPPHNTLAEHALLGALMIDNDRMGEVAAIARQEHFYWQDHQEIFGCMSGLIAAGLPATPITIKGYLRQPEMGGMSTMAYLAKLAGSATTSVNAVGYAAIVADFATRRTLMKVGTTLAQRAQFDPVESTGQILIEAAEAELLDARSTTPQGHLAGMTAGEGATWMIERVRQLKAGLLKSTTISTGIADLDRATSGGFGRGQLWLMAGRPGMGKTVVMTSLSRRAARHEGVLVFQLEVTRDQQFARYMADLSYVRNRPLTFGKIMEGIGLDDEDMWRLEDAQKRLSGLHLRIECEPSVTIAQIAFAVKAEKKRLAKIGVSLGVVFLDYLKFIKAGDRYKGNRVLEIGEISGFLKTLAKTEDICVVLLAQLNRGVEAQGREDKRPTMADLRDSGELEQDADVVVLLYRDAYYLQKNPKLHSDPELSARLIDRQNSLEFILGKNRAGPTPTLDLWCDVAASSVASQARGLI